MKELVWLTIKQLIDTKIVKLVYKALHNEVPECGKELFHRLPDAHNRELPNLNTHLHVPLLGTFSGPKSLAYRVLCIWNNLSNETKAGKLSSAFTEN